ncbi:MAG TPA: MBL fold metallo-hydrolase [Chloroflexota bacterium]|nr:MBL fold metallo-hydrolase [Chloroflexota bacterium]
MIADPQVFHDRPPAAVLTAPNAGPKTLTGTHTYLVGRSPAYVVDPGPLISSHVDAIVGALRELQMEPAGILLTHSHPDHAPAAGPLAERLGVDVWASPSADAAGVTRRYESHQSFALDGEGLHVLPSPGHTRDHVAFWTPDARILFAGDTVLGEGTSVIAPPEGNMSDYMRTLDAFLALQPRIIAPGHGPLVSDPMTLLRGYIEHRRAREKAILTTLHSSPADIPTLVDRIYLGLVPELRDLAELSVAAQLEKLESEGAVRRTGTTYEAIKPVD